MKICVSKYLKMRIVIQKHNCRRSKLLEICISSLDLALMVSQVPYKTILVEITWVLMIFLNFLYMRISKLYTKVPIKSEKCGYVST